MNRTKLRLVHDSLHNTSTNEAREIWGYENAQQLSFFQDDDKNCILIVAMNEMNRFSFNDLLITQQPVSIIDTRSHPDFFGFFRSTQFALAQFDKAEINYLHIPLKYQSEISETWEIRSKFLENLNKIAENNNVINNMQLLLVPSTDIIERCQNLLLSLPTFNDHWRLERL